VKDFVRIMKALSEPNRVKILKILQRRNLCVCGIQAILDIAQPTVSSHHKVLQDAQLNKATDNVAAELAAAIIKKLQGDCQEAQSSVVWSVTRERPPFITVLKQTCFTAQRKSPIMTANTRPSSRVP